MTHTTTRPPKIHVKYYNHTVNARDHKGSHRDHIGTSQPPGFAVRVGHKTTKDDVVSQAGRLKGDDATCYKYTINARDHTGSHGITRDHTRNNMRNCTYQRNPHAGNVVSDLLRHLL